VGGEVDSEIVRLIVSCADDVAAKILHTALIENNCIKFAGACC
jgi:hypothetical protein